MKSKKSLKIWIVTGLIVFPVMFLTYCTKHNQVIGTVVPATLNTDTLYSVSGTATFEPQSVAGGYATPWNGDISAWSNAPALTVLVTVPTPGNNIFTGFNGNSDSVTIQSMYDANNLYILMQWSAAEPNCANSPWYYNPAGTGYNYWAQESAGPTATSSGTEATTFRPGFVQDEVVMMFNISTPAFMTLSCYAACHTFSSYGAVDTPGGAAGGGAMWTNGPTEFLDCWRARTLQVLNTNQANDCDVNNGIQASANGELNKQFVTADPQVNTTDGGFSNTQKITVTGTSTKVSVPMFVYYPISSYQIYPNSSSVNSNGAILQSDTATKAIRVVAVDTNGVLTLQNGSIIDPRTAANSTNFQRVGMGDGKYCIPGSIVSPYTGDRGDVTANMYWTGTGWRMLLIRALNTGHVVNPATNSADDVTFTPSTVSNYPFAFGVMFNGADNEHAIVDGLTLHFKK